MKFQILKKYISEAKYAIVLTALLIGLFGFFFGERMSDFGSHGDEKIYYHMTKDFSPVVFGRNLPDYYVQRILPSGLVHFTLKLFSVPATVPNVINTFGIYNIILHILIAYVWCLVARELRISVRGQWLGFVGLFCNFAILKYIPYFQVSTDLHAYFFGITLLYFYLRNNLWGLLLVTVLGAFTWASAIYLGAVLILFPKEERDTKEYKHAPFGINYILALIAVIFVFLEIQKVGRVIEAGKLSGIGSFSSGATMPLLSVIHLSTAIVLIYLFITISKLSDNARFFRIRYWLGQLNAVRCVAAVFIFVSIKACIYLLASVHNHLPLDYWIFNIVAVAIILPGLFFLAHVIYFGPIVIFFLFLWRPFCRMIQGYGFGLTLAMGLTVLLSLHTESRIQMNFYPLWIPFLVKLTDTFKWEKSVYWFMAILSLLYSKIWLTIHHEWLVEGAAFPNQCYGMNFGQHMAYSMYAVQGAFVLVSAFVIYMVMFQDRKGLASR